MQMQSPGGGAQERCERWQSVCKDLATSPIGSWRIFVKKIQSLSFLATLAVVIGMISWGSALNAQSTPSAPADQQQPQTQPAPSPEMPPAAQQTPSSTPDQTAPSSQSPSSQTPSSTPDQTAPSSQAPSAQPPSSQTPDATAPESGSKTANPSGAPASSGAAASSNPDGSQTFSGTVVKQGDKYMLKDDSGKTYDIDHQTDVAKFEGKRVRVQGTLDPSGKIMVK